MLVSYELDVVVTSGYLDFLRLKGMILTHQLRALLVGDEGCLVHKQIAALIPALLFVRYVLGFGTSDMVLMFSELLRYDEKTLHCSLGL